VNRLAIAAAPVCIGGSLPSALAATYQINTTRISPNVFEESGSINNAPRSRPKPRKTRTEPIQ
jgi:hypothetical protein